MAKKKDLPYMPFYVGDWMKAPDVRALPLDVRMIWFEMLCLMWESKRRGYLEINGKCVSTSVISKMLGCVITEFEQSLRVLEDFGLYSRDENGTIFCRRMARDEEIRVKKQKAGKIGMKNRYSVNTSVITESITNADIDIDNEINKSFKEGGTGETKKSKFNLETILEYASAKNIPADEATEFFNHYAAKDWIDGAGVPIMNPKYKLENWHKEQTRRKVEKVINPSTTSGNRNFNNQPSMKPAPWLTENKNLCDCGCGEKAVYRKDKFKIASQECYELLKPSRSMSSMEEVIEKINIGV
jgi:hypothetical protein